LAAAMEQDGTGELAQAQREAWVAVSEEAMELKARRERRERREAAERRAAMQAQREAEERAAREEAARVEAERRAARQAAEAREQARAEAERRERAWREEEARREAMRRRAEERRRMEAEERRAEERRRAREESRAEERRRADEGQRAEQLRAQEEERRKEEERRAEGQERRAEEEAFRAEQEALRATEDRQLEAERLQAADRHRADHARQRRPVDVPSTATVEARTDSAADLRAPAGGANDSGPPHERHQEGGPKRFPSADRRPLTGAELARWRSRLDLTQQAAADRLGVRQGTVSKAESRADAPLGPSLREALADALREERRSA
ncbi:MAG: helix-turn-helix transcriptional regulator, partial [Planctomycetes bacterium]|nr:helix-turn-helix transcriptional regulator [Planctomycetota bacterium]